MSLKRRFKGSKECDQEYTCFYTDVIKSGYVEQVPQNQLNCTDGKVWYIQHHGVYHPKNKTLRVVSWSNQIPVWCPVLVFWLFKLTRHSGKCCSLILTSSEWWLWMKPRDFIHLWKTDCDMRLQMAISRDTLALAKLNPADEASRGMSAVDFLQSKQW